MTKHTETIGKAIRQAKKGMREKFPKFFKPAIVMLAKQMLHSGDKKKPAGHRSHRKDHPTA